MTLVLQTLRCPDGVGADRREVTRAPFSIGRGTESDWVLPDPEKILSKRHCNIIAQGDTWLVTDASSNGTFLNGRALDPDLPHPLRDQDRLSLGNYEFEVRVADDLLEYSSEAPTRFGNRSDAVHGQRLTSDPFPLHENAVEVARPSIGLPSDFDDIGTNDRVAEHPYPVRDDTPDLKSDFRAPRPSTELLPDDWDDETPPPAAADPKPEDRFAEPRRSTTLTPEFGSASTEIPEDGGRRENSSGLAQSPENSASIARPTETALQLRQDLAPAENVMPAAPRPASGGGFGAFAIGACYRGPAPADPDAALRLLGSAFRAMVVGLRQSMIARATVKSEFRIDQTMIRAVGNNPIKFASDDDDALAALMGINRQGGMTAKDAVTEAMRDIRTHELAVAVAMQGAVRDLLDELAPQRISQDLTPGKFEGLLGTRKQKGWDAYVARHAQIVRALSDEFDSIFGRSFARAYEVASKETSEAGAP